MWIIPLIAILKYRFDKVKFTYEKYNKTINIALYVCRHGYLVFPSMLTIKQNRN